MMKEAIKAVVRRVPGKKIIFSFVRLFGVPSFYKSLRFKGRFRLPLTKEASIKLWNNDDYSIETEWFWRGINGWEAASIQIWMNLCSSKTFGSVPVIWDIGACEGIYALVAKALSPTAHVLALEPLPEAFQRLNANIELNNLNINAIKAACSESDGTAELFIDGQTNSTEASLVSGQLSRPSSTRSVVTRAISSIIEELQLKSMDFVKIDVEGFEPSVLKGMGNYLGKYRPVMIIEVLNPDVGNQVNQVMSDLDYRYWDINDDSRNGSLGIKPSAEIKKGICLNWLLVPAEKAEALEECWRQWILK